MRLQGSKSSVAAAQQMLLNAQKNAACLLMSCKKRWCQMKQLVGMLMKVNSTLRNHLLRPDMRATLYLGLSVSLYLAPDETHCCDCCCYLQLIVRLTLDNILVLKWDWWGQVASIAVLYMIYSAWYVPNNCGNRNTNLSAIHHSNDLIFSVVSMKDEYHGDVSEE